MRQPSSTVEEEASGREETRCVRCATCIAAATGGHLIMPYIVYIGQACSIKLV
jgi:hypothetical protein